MEIVLFSRNFCRFGKINVVSNSNTTPRLGWDQE